MRVRERSSPVRFAVALIASALGAACATVTPPKLPVVEALQPDPWAEAHTECLALLSRLIKVNTEDGNNTRPAAQLLVEYLQDRGLKAQLVTLDGSRVGVWARWSSEAPARRPMLLVSHLDTAASEASEWAADRGPLSATIARDALWGRGTRGGKALAATQVTVLAALHKAGFKPPRDVFLFIAPDGEQGTGRSVAVVAAEQLELTQSAFAIGQGFGLRRVLDSKRLLHMVTRAERGQATFDMVATARSDEVERDPERAVARLAQALEVVSEAKRKPRLTSATYAMLQGLSQGVHPLLRPLYRWPPLTRLLVLPGAANSPEVGPMVHDSVYAAELSTSATKPIRRARAELKARLLPETRPAEMRNWIRQRVGLSAVHVTVREAREASESRDWPELLGAVDAVDDYDSTWALAPEPTDLAQLRALGVPAYGFTPFVTTTDSDRSRVGTDEHLPLDELQRGVERYGLFVQYILRIDPPEAPTKQQPTTPAYK